MKIRSTVVAAFISVCAASALAAGEPLKAPAGQKLPAKAGAAASGKVEVPAKAKAQAKAPEAAKPNAPTKVEVAKAPEADAPPVEGGAPVKLAPPPAAGQVHTVVGGDTLWEISGQFLSSPEEWPRLWSYNPQIKNPHWIYPGEKVNLTMPPKPPVLGPVEREITLVVEKVNPAGAGSAGAADAGASKTGGAGGEAKTGAQGADAAAPASGGQGSATASLGEAVEVNSHYAQDYVSVERPLRVGSVDNASIGKMFAAQGEEVKIAPRPGVSLAAGEKLTLFDDSRAIKDPATMKAAGRHVRILGQLEVLRSSKDGVWGRIISSSDAVEDGHGLMPYREVPRTVAAAKVAKTVEGVVLAGHHEIEMFSTSDVIFLNKGSDDGLLPGVRVEIPVQPGQMKSQGFSEDVKKPIALALIVSTQPKSSTAWIIQSRRGVGAGARFTASADSP